MNTREYLNEIMLRYKHENAKEPEALEKRLYDFMQLDSGEMEGFEGEEEIKVQREYSIKFAFGHNHDFGTFKIKGVMGERHINLLEMFIDHLGLPTDLINKSVVDIGVWCGGTTLLLAGMGAKVVAFEEVIKYANCAYYLMFQFQERMRYRPVILSESLYFMDRYLDTFDYVIFPGVLYHLTDPILALRILFNALKDGGELYMETECDPLSSDKTINYVGPSIAGNNWFIPSPKTVDTMLEDVGFELGNGSLTANPNRYIVKATRVKWKPMMKAGFSKRVR